MTQTRKQSLRYLMAFKLAGWLLLLPMLFGCSQDLVYQRSVSELNQKAHQLMQQGDFQGAVSRLESARDLMPNESSIVYNLAIAYKENGQLDQSIETFEQFLEKFPSVAQKTNAMRSLGVVMEEKADKLLAEAWKQQQGKAKVEVVQQLSEDGLGYYERAIALYEKMLQESALELSEKESIQTHIANLQQSMTKVREGKLEELQFF